MTALPLVLATGNAGKVREFSALLDNLGFSVAPQSELDVVEAEETGLTFVENAILKARNASEQTGLPALADDSGLVVGALQGEPGIYSSRYAGVDADDQANNAKLLEALQDVPEAERTAHFRCCIVLMRHADDPIPVIAEASWQGRILTAPDGDGGFGYDPLFFVPDQGCSAAALDSALKNKISHRGQAMQILRERLAHMSEAS